MPIRYLQLIAADQSNYQDFIISRRHEEVLASVVRFLLAQRGEWDVLSLRHLPEDSTTARVLLRAQAHFDGSLTCTVGGRLRCIFTEVDGTWEQYAARSSSTRSKIAARSRKLQKLGPLTWFHCSSAKQYESALASFVDLHRRRWKDTGTPSQFDDDRYFRFYLEAGCRLLPRKQIDLFMLEVGAKPVSALMTLHYDRRWVQQLTAYDPDLQYAQASPSLVMHEIFVKELFGQQGCVFDFGHYYPYKEAWASSYKNTVDIKVHHGGVMARYDQLSASLSEALRGRIRRHRGLLRAARYLRRLLRARAARDREETEA